MHRRVCCEGEKEVWVSVNKKEGAKASSQTVEKGVLTPWPPLRGGSARRRWGRELYGCPKYFGLWQGSLPPPLRGTSLAEGGFSTRCVSLTGEGFLIFASEASTPPYCCRACRCIRRAGSRQGPRRRGPRQEPGLRFQTRPRRTRRPWAGNNQDSLGVSRVWAKITSAF